MGGRFSRSWRMIKHSAAILQQDRELMVFPLLSSIAALLVFISFVPLIIPAPAMQQGEAGSFNALALGLLYLSEYFVMFFFNTALVGAAMIRMDGGDPTISDGLRIAWSKAGRILGYAMIAATVGILLRAVGERFGLLGRMIVGLFGIAWTAASFLAVPILASRDVGPLDALKESATLLKQTWGENVISNSGIGLIFILIYVLAFVIAGFMLSTASTTGNMSLIIGIIAVSIIGLIVIGLLQTALQGIFSAVLYRFATNGQNTGGFSADTLSQAFTAKLS
ncbi:MAG TPA: DUF6159 family protein [Gammaproteobacteria bacterium]|jgi:hypothetical protein|nr:hypothetical protein [Gammaproteobacteria bacterium]MDP7152818.1 DUF6159 family protein [Gammaproteobacteria bacterium]MDP7297132.1 DUF6159 family protein [Gammaproteobacteria bacterium]HJP39292.1 DUF6159 family protein [Gammaproteobacteria bacterium]